jgi:hypothetical protein
VHHRAGGGRICARNYEIKGKSLCERKFDVQSSGMLNVKLCFWRVFIGPFSGSGSKMLRRNIKAKDEEIYTLLKYSL